MGCGCTSRGDGVLANYLPGPNFLQYNRNITLQALKQTSDGRSPVPVQITFPVTEPQFAFSRQVVVAGRNFWVSGCVLPGMDPHMTTDKQCQDMCFAEGSGESLLCGLFDGHGSNGRAVAQFCAKNISQIYTKDIQSAHSSPSSFLESVTKRVDSDLKLSNNGVDVSGSGSTEVLLLLYQDNVYIAGVGDSRGVLGSLSPPEEPPAVPRPLRGEGKTNVETHRSKRALPIESTIQPVQLTKDQKPEDTEELIRIFRCGGHVKQLVDEKGNKIGPYRVWKPNTNGPGIAMSRSIGDTVGTDLGVISDPVLTQYSLNWEADLFMISASDGIWDVMDNEDVVRYLERYRLHCQRGTSTIPSGEAVRCSNATIAQMICEEARARWYAIIEREEVLIDDISCVVVEFRDEPGDISEQPIKPPSTEPTRR